jgi:hypothetical protein
MDQNNRSEESEKARQFFQSLPPDSLVEVTVRVIKKKKMKRAALLEIEAGEPAAPRPAGPLRPAAWVESINRLYGFLPEKDLSVCQKAVASQDQPVKVFDWEKAARIIAKKKPASADAGLAGDWDWTAGTVYRNGEPVLDSCCFTYSTWATPSLQLDDSLKKIPCWRWSGRGEIDSETSVWPSGALSVLRGGA